MSNRYSVRPRKPDLVKIRQELLAALLEGNEVAASRLVNETITKRWEPSFVYVHVVGHCLAEIGTRWHAGELAIPVEHRA
ncbi:MAG: hypothetical protein CL731_07345, partial [Chloroflexi bacterium]|nr:hypothetical protein [Chloroflexota bacterium]